jgi:hypothetical protein
MKTKAAVLWGLHQKCCSRSCGPLINESKLRRQAREEKVDAQDVLRAKPEPVPIRMNFLCDPRWILGSRC